MALNVVIMAAGKGTRMKSATPKVLHRLAGRSLLQHVLDAAARVGADRTVVITGHGADEVEAAWRIVDPIIDAWIAGPEPEMPNYTSGTWGPEAADELLTREGRRWRRL